MYMKENTIESTMPQTEFLTFVVDSIADPVYVKDNSFHYVMVNDAFCTMFGKPREAVEYRTDYDLFHKSEADASRQIDIAAFASDREIVKEERLSGINGETLMVSSKRKPLKDPVTGASYLVCVMREISEYKSYEKKLNIYKSRLQEMVEERTVELMNSNVGLEIEMSEKQRAQELLRDALQMFELVINNIPQHVYWKDKNLNYLGCNSIFAQMAGLMAPDEIRGKSDYDLPWPKEEAESNRRFDMEVISNNRPIYNSIETMTIAGGERIWVETTKVPLHDSDGNVVGIICSQHNISERRLFEEALSRSERKYRSTFEISPEIIVLIDGQGTILDINNRIKDLLGISSESLIGRRLTELDFLSDNSQSMIAKGIRSHLDGASHLSYEIDVPVPDGRVLYGSVVSAPIYDKEDNVTSILAIISDITDRKLAEDKMKDISKDLEKRVIERTAQLQKALSELEEENKQRKITEIKLLAAKDELSKALDKEKELNELKNRFISMISHEYRTPLTVILTSTYIIEQLFEGKGKDEFIKFLSKIRTSVETMTQLHDNVLTFGKSEAGVIVQSQETINLVSFMENLIEEVKIVDNNNHLIMFSHEGMECIINSDSKLLKQIFNNLLINATKYSNHGSPINILLEKVNHEVFIKVSDKGFGIMPEDLKHLFDPFHRGKNIGAKSGSGLGLAIVKKCVEQLNGNITVESRLNYGSAFTVTLPCRY